MVSLAKRTKYVYENEMSTSEEESYEDTDYVPNNKNDKFRNKTQRPGRKPKCFTKNALMARENRLKKKMYITKLEDDVCSLRSENKKLTTVVDNQSFLITELKKEVKYLKSVIANSSDISKLIRNIHQTTGMSVSSSLDKNLSLKNVCIPKLKQPIARKTAHPWEETKQYPSYPTPESNDMTSPSSGFSDDLTNDFLNAMPLDFPIDFPDDELLNTFNFEEEKFYKKPAVMLEEHNYTATKESSDDSLEDVGVCLHVSKHRLSLEFCSSCSESAMQAWLN